MIEEYINRVAVLNDIEELFILCYETLPNECGHHFITEKELETHLEHVKNLPVLVNKNSPRWVRVEDGLPKPIHPSDPHYVPYLICDSLGYMYVADYTYGKYSTAYSFHVDGEEVTDVIYWMPIEPPGEEV